MVTAKAFCDQCRIPLNEGWGYIWGTYGQTWTASSRITSKAPASSKTQAAKYGNKWIGKRVTDCSGLLYWASKQLGFSLPHGANTMYNSYCKSKGKLTASTAMKPGYAVFLYDGKTRHHVGVYVGNDTVIEAKGTQYGVVTSHLSHWDEWGELKGIDYSNEEEEHMPTNPVSRPTLRMGSRGEAVRDMQKRLLANGYLIDADGVFGTNTATALMSFQRSHGLVGDGVCGPLTWAMLEANPTQSTPAIPEGMAPENYDPADAGMTIVDVNDLDWSETEDDTRFEDILERLKAMHVQLGDLIEEADRILREGI